MNLPKMPADWIAKDVVAVWERGGHGQIVARNNCLDDVFEPVIMSEHGASERGLYRVERESDYQITRMTRVASLPDAAEILGDDASCREEVAKLESEVKRLTFLVSGVREFASRLQRDYQNGTELYEVASLLRRIMEKMEVSDG